MICHMASVVLVGTRTLMRGTLVGIRDGDCLLSRVTTTAAPRSSLTLTGRLRRVGRAVSSCGIATIHRTRVMDVHTVTGGSVTSRLSSAGCVVPGLRCSNAGLATCMGQRIGAFAKFAVATRRLRVLIVGRHTHRLYFRKGH